jgi:hypothetical protein
MARGRQYHVLHFSGHGGYDTDRGEGYLTFADRLDGTGFPAGRVRLRGEEHAAPGTCSVVWGAFGDDPADRFE